MPFDVVYAMSSRKVTGDTVKGTAEASILAWTLVKLPLPLSKVFGAWSPPASVFIAA